MRIDHLAYRVADRYKTANFFIDCFGYRIDPEIPEGFDITFEDGSMAKCLVLLPPEKKIKDISWLLNTHDISGNDLSYHMAPEIFISDGTTDSIVKKWVDDKNGIGGIHHIAYQVDSVAVMMDMMVDKGYVEFTTDKPLTCPGLTQIFTKPSVLTGVIYEFIERTEQGFCKENVKDLMNSTKNI
jgi:hypothetical protein